MEKATALNTRAGWQEEETARLLSAVRAANASGAPLRSVFESLSGDLGRKPNSIRNYYYTCLRRRPEGATLPVTPFETFTPEETHHLLRQVLMARGQGRSVRSCVMAMAQGSHSRMLRYQNKYRALLRTRPELIESVRQELAREGLPCPPPRLETADPAFCDPEDTAAARLMAQPCVAAMLEGIKELIRRAARAEDASTIQCALDRLKVQHDLQRLAWEKDYLALADCLEKLTTVLKEFFALERASQLPQMDLFQESVLTLLPQAEQLLEDSRNLN